MKLCRVKKIKRWLASIHPDAVVVIDDEVKLVLSTGEEMISGEFIKGTQTRVLMEELERIYDL